MKQREQGYRRSFNSTSAAACSELISKYDSINIKIEACSSSHNLNKSRLVINNKVQKPWQRQQYADIEVEGNSKTSNTRNHKMTVTFKLNNELDPLYTSGSSLNTDMQIIHWNYQSIPINSSPKKPLSIQKQIKSTDPNSEQTKSLIHHLPSCTSSPAVLSPKTWENFQSSGAAADATSPPPPPPPPSIFSPTLGKSEMKATAI